VWARSALLGLLAVAAGLNVWGLSSGGWSNAFYSAAVQVASVSWTAFFFGSSDAANSISVAGPTITRLLSADSSWYSWVAATVGSINASGYQLATGRPVMPIGGFTTTSRAAAEVVSQETAIPPPRSRLGSPLPSPVRP
jgi:hypothetical protein